MKALTHATAKLFTPLRFDKADKLHIALDKDGERFVCTAYRVNPYDNRRVSPSLHMQRTLWARFPERKELDGDCRWELPCTDITANIIDGVVPRELIDFESDAKIVYDYLLVSFVQQGRNADNFAKFKNLLHLSREQEIYGMHEATIIEASGHAGEEVPDVSGLRLHPDPDLRLAFYQQVAAKNALDSEAYALFMEQGTGKTPVVISVIDNDQPRVKAKENRAHRSLIVCPNNVRLNWSSEFEKFSLTKGKVTILRGGEIERIKQLIDALTAQDERITIVIGYEMMVRMWKVLKAIRWDVAVLDEGHYIKWPETQRAKHAFLLRELADKRMLLTGTPIANTPLDTYAQFEFLGKGFSGFMSWKNFRSFYGVFEKNQEGRQALVALQNLPFMQERLARLSFIVEKKDVLPDLPDKVYDVIEVEMTKEQEEVYEALSKYLAAEIKSDLDGAANKTIAVNNILTKLLRLAQITSGFYKWNPTYNEEGEVVAEGGVDRFDPNPKIEALIEILKEKGPNDKTIVWANWIQDIKSIRARLEQEGIGCVTFYGGTKEDDRAIAEYEFNHNADIKVFVGNPAAGGTGLNLLGYPPGEGDDYPSNCNHVIYYSQDWSSIKRSQSEDRAHRRGTREPVRITDLCIPRTIDEEIRARVLKKRINAASIADVREILRNVLRGFIDE